MVAENRDSVPDHGGVDGECDGEVCGEAVLRHAWVGAGFLEEVVLDAGFDHPPAEEALESDEGGDAGNPRGHAGGDSAPGDEIEARENEGEANDTAPEPVGPFHVVYELVALEIHVWIQDAVFGRVAVFGEVFLPGFGGQGRECAGDGLPFRD